MRTTLDLDEDILAAKGLRQRCHLYTTHREVTKRRTDRGAEADQIAETVPARVGEAQSGPQAGAAGHASERRRTGRKSREPEEARGPRMDDSRVCRAELWSSAKGRACSRPRRCRR